MNKWPTVDTPAFEVSLQVTGARGAFGRRAARVSCPFRYLALIVALCIWPHMVFAEGATFAQVKTPHDKGPPEKTVNLYAWADYFDPGVL